jgi:hypothetical protein
MRSRRDLLLRFRCVSPDGDGEREAGVGPLAIAIVLLLLAGYRTSLLRVFVRPAEVREAGETLSPEERAFIREVPERSGGGSVAFVFLPMRSWGDGYPYHFYRAAYALAPAEAFAAMGETNAAVWSAAARAQWIAAWPAAALPPGYATVRRDHDGVLARRIRP